MKKMLALILALVLVFALIGCTNQTPAAEETTQPVEAEQTSTTEETLAEQTTQPASDSDIPAVFTDASHPIKVAAIRNLTADDGTKLLLSTMSQMGEAWGWTVDTFITNNNDLQLQETVAQCAQKGYDAIFISHGKEEYSYDMIKPLVDAGIKVVTFDTVANDADGNPIPGVTAIAQDDYAMADLTLSRIVEDANGSEPVKILKLWYGPGGAPALDRRNVTYEEYEAKGLITTTVTIGPTNMDDCMGDTYQKTAAALNLYPAGDIDYAWGSWDELAKGGLQAILEAGRTEIKVVTVDCSDVDLNLMREYPDTFVACCGCDQSLPGVAAMRIMAYKLAGLETPDSYQIPVSLIRGEELKPDTTIATLADTVEGWGVLPDFIAPWMEALETANK